MKVSFTLPKCHPGSNYHWDIERNVLVKGDRYSSSSDGESMTFDKVNIDGVVYVVINGNSIISMQEFRNIIAILDLASEESHVLWTREQATKFAEEREAEEQAKREAKAKREEQSTAS